MKLLDIAQAFLNEQVDEEDAKEFTRQALELIGNGADIEEKNEDSKTALGVLVSNGNEDLVFQNFAKHLIKAGANPLIPCCLPAYINDSRNPLMTTAVLSAIGRREEAGCGVRDVLGGNVLHYLASTDMPMATRFLEEDQENMALDPHDLPYFPSSMLNYKREGGLTPLLVAWKYCESFGAVDVDLAMSFSEALFNRGADLLEADDKGNTFFLLIHQSMANGMQLPASASESWERLQASAQRQILEGETAQAPVRHSKGLRL